VNITLNVHESWRAHPGPLARVLAHVAALEAPAPWTPPAVREPGQDDDDGLAELLAGMDDAPEPSPAPSPAPPAVAKAPKPSPAPAAATPPTGRDWDGVPRTGRSLYRWACDHKALPDVNRVGKAHGYPRKVTDWEPSQVAAAYAILTAEPAVNGRAH
jgi:hypothetical protein